MITKKLGYLLDGFANTSKDQTRNKRFGYG